MPGKPREVPEENLAGHVYIASNPLMPGLVKVGRTRGSVRGRLKSLYTTGVPGPFKEEAARFFVDSVDGEWSIIQVLSSAGRRCQNREFFLMDTRCAVSVLDEQYRHQHQRFDEDTFEWKVGQAFQSVLSSGDICGAEQIIDALCGLTHVQRRSMQLNLLAKAIEMGEERIAIWLVRYRGVDPDVPLPLSGITIGIPGYHLTTYEYSIGLGLMNLRGNLERIGCNLRESNALFWVVDTLINTDRNDEWKDRFLSLGLNLVKQGADTHKLMNLALFAEAPRRGILPAPFRYDLFPRNSNESCSTIVAALAHSDPRFAALHQAMNESANTWRN